MSSLAEAEDDVLSALQAGDFSFNSQLFYFNRDFDGGRNPEALTFGGIAKYQTAPWHGLSVGAGYFGATNVFNLIDRDRALGSSMLERGSGDDIGFFGELFLKYERDKLAITLGRQRLDTPLIDDHRTRMLPTAYNGATVRYQFNDATLVELGYIERFTELGSRADDFVEKQSEWGDDGFVYIMAKTDMGMWRTRGQFIQTLDDTVLALAKNEKVDHYAYIDGHRPLQWGEHSYLRTQLGYNRYEQSENAYMFGLKAGTSLGRTEVILMYNKIAGNEFETIESGPVFSDWQQGYDNYQPSDALGGQVIFHPLEQLSLKFGYIRVDIDASDVRDYSDRLKDDYAEFNADIKYRLSADTQLRLRYSDKDQRAEAASNIPDSTDFRLILSHRF